MVLNLCDLGWCSMLIDEKPHIAWMLFDAQIMPYIGDDSWVESALYRAKQVAQLNNCPPHATACDTGRWLREATHAQPLIDQYYDRRRSGDDP